MLLSSMGLEQCTLFSSVNHQKGYYALSKHIKSDLYPFDVAVYHALFYYF